MRDFLREHYLVIPQNLPLSPLVIEEIDRLLVEGASFRKQLSKPLVRTLDALLAPYLTQIASFQAEPHVQTALRGAFLTAAFGGDLPPRLSDALKFAVLRKATDAQRELGMAFATLSVVGRRDLASVMVRHEGMRASMRGAYAAGRVALELSKVGKVYFAPKREDFRFAVDLFFHLEGSSEGYGIQVMGTLGRGLVLVRSHAEASRYLEMCKKFAAVHEGVRRLNEDHHRTWHPALVSLGFGRIEIDPLSGLEKLQQLASV